MNEIWRDVVGYENLYQTSNLGRARSVDRWVKDTNGSLRFYRGRILKPFKNTQGYLQIGLWKNGKVKYFTVHRLVAEAFLPNTDNLPEVNHKDENKLNNVVSNLEWCDRTYNVNYGTAIQRSSKKRSKPILQYTLDGQFVREWESTSECSRNGFNQGAVAACCRGELKKYKDFIWKYK